MPFQERLWPTRFLGFRCGCGVKKILKFFKILEFWFFKILSPNNSRHPNGGWFSSKGYFPCKILNYQLTLVHFGWFWGYWRLLRVLQHVLRAIKNNEWNLWFLPNNIESMMILEVVWGSEKREKNYKVSTKRSRIFYHKCTFIIVLYKFLNGVLILQSLRFLKGWQFKKTQREISNTIYQLPSTII